MSIHQLAQINIGVLNAPIDSPQLADFANNLNLINALAEIQPGFLWRLTGEGNNATDIRAFGNPLMAINMSVWTDVASLAAFVYRTDHRNFMRRRAEWFEKMELYMCLWWVPEGVHPTPAEGIERLETLRAVGPSQKAFTFKAPFGKPQVRHAPDLDETNAAEPGTL